MRMGQNNRRGEDHRLARPATIKTLRNAAIAALAGAVIADLAVEHHPHFGIDGSFAFGGWFGFLSCALLAVVAKLVGALLQRPDNYYDN
jgi:hypothetical protein